MFCFYFKYQIFDDNIFLRNQIGSNNDVEEKCCFTFTENNNF